MNGDLLISKVSPKLILFDADNANSSYPRIDFETSNNQGVSIEHNEFDGELPIAGYGLIIGPSTNNSQFPNQGTLSFNVLGNIYAGGTGISSLSRVLTTADEGAGNGLDADTLDGQQGSYYQPASTALTTSTNFGGDVSGTYNNIVVANDSHTHDGRYYTETEADSRYTQKITRVITSIDVYDATAANKYYEIGRFSFSSLEGLFIIDLLFKGGGGGMSSRHILPATYNMDYLGDYGVSFTNNQWHKVSSSFDSPRHYMTDSTDWELQAKPNGNTIDFRIVIRDGDATSTASLTAYVSIKHSNDFANSTYTELTGTGTDATVYQTIPNIIGGLDGLTLIGNDSEFLGDVNAANIGTDTDNSVVILNSAGYLKTDEIDSRVWGSTLVDSSASANYVPKMSDSNTLSNSLIYDNGTNIGIGTTSPSEKLHVSDTVFVDYPDGNGTSLKIGRNDLSNYWEVNHAGSDFRLFNTAGSGSDVIIGLNAAGTSYSNRLGIGVSPTTQLDVNGSAKISSNLTVDTNTLYVDSTNNRVGIGTTSPSYKLEVNGSFAATTKSFIIPHPTKEGKKLRYASLEGPENGVYIRGKSGADILELPEYWEKLVDEDSVTVTLTPVGKFQPLYVVSQSNKQIEIGGVEGEYNYVIYGERKDVEKLIVEVD